MQLEVRAAPIPDVVSEVRPRSFWRVIFSFPVVLNALLVVLMVLTIRSRFNDPDMWWHLKTGEIIWNTHHIPTVDMFSFTTNSHAYIPHEWFPQLTIYGAYHFGGYTGLMLWFCLFAALFVVAGYALCSLYSGNLKVAFLGGIVTWLFATVALSIRPQMIGYLLLLCELLVIHLGRSRSARYFFSLPPLFAIWVNCHGSFFLGLILLGAILACSFVELEWGLLVSRPWNRGQRITLTIAFVLSIAALFINPIGLKQLTYPVDTIASQHVQMQAVSEWQPPRLDDPRTVALFAITGLILLVPLIRRIKLTVQELLFLVLGFGFAIEHERMLFVFGILAAPILCRLLAQCWDGYEPNRDRPIPNAVILAISAVAVLLAFPSLPQLNSQVENGNPVKAVNFINEFGLSGNMLNEYGYGGYLIWAAPRYKVFVDGRGDVFEWTGVLTEYGKWMTLQADPNVLLDKYHINFCLLARDVPMSYVLPLMPAWKKIYSDDAAVVFARSATSQTIAEASRNARSN